MTFASSFFTPPLLSIGTAITVSGATDVTYAELVALIGASELVPGGVYRITDFATKHFIVDSDGTQYTDTIVTGSTEALIVVAVSTSALAPDACSALYPQDVLTYDWNPANRQNDLAFTDQVSGDPVTGFKGVITFRWDTRQNNSAGFDWRHCKARRWAIDSSMAWSAGTYSQGQLVTHNDLLYCAIVDGTTEQPGNGFEWTQVLDLGDNTHWLNSPSGQFGLTADVADYADYTLFAGGYTTLHADNHFAPKPIDADPLGDEDTLLPLNIFLGDADGNTFGPGCTGNTFGIECYNNRFASRAVNNIVGDQCANNDVRDGFDSNIVGLYCVDNEIGIGCNQNKIGTGFSSNELRAWFHDNVIGASFYNNVVGDEFGGNGIGANFDSNVADIYVTANTIGTGCKDNRFGSTLNGNIIGDNFRRNLVAPRSLTSQTLTGATHIYATYNCDIFLRADGTPRLRYYNNSDVAVIVAVTA